MDPIHRAFRNALRAGLVAGALAAPGAASAAVVDVGFDSNWDCTISCVERYQQVYAAALFSGPVTINTVSFFAAGGTFNGSTWQMSLSTSVNTVGALDPAFANNVGGDAQVFDTLTISGTPNVGDPITFSGGFAYDPNLGDLLVDIVLTAGSTDFSSPGLYATQSPGDTDRAYAFASTVTADGYNQNGYALHTRFETDLVAAPEPGTLAVIGFGLAGLAMMRRRHRG